MSNRVPVKADFTYFDELLVETELAAGLEFTIRFLNEVRSQGEKFFVNFMRFEFVPAKSASDFARFRLAPKRSFKGIKA